MSMTNVNLSAYEGEIEDVQNKVNDHMMVLQNLGRRLDELHAVPAPTMDDLQAVYRAMSDLKDAARKFAAEIGEF